MKLSRESRQAEASKQQKQINDIVRQVIHDKLPVRAALHQIAEAVRMSTELALTQQEGS